MMSRLQPVSSQPEQIQTDAVNGKEGLRCATVASGLDEDVDQVAVLIDRTPEILPFAVDPDEDLVQEPGISEATLSSFECPRVLRTEFQTPLLIVSYETMMPRFATRSSTSRKLREKR